jgi:hypothetical protein
MNASAEPQAAVEAANWRANVAFSEKLLSETAYEYTSKARLRDIARQALATLYAIYTVQAEAAEHAAAAEPASSLVTP